ncbi:hypothetical protein [Yersinia thracica]|uniref:hypothetical protein n=1 Tax=Yersinia thracica TaxID=2890319 RepID=UPI00157C0971|nr:hypothetical protein [Yersinia thracica]
MKLKSVIISTVLFVLLLGVINYLHFTYFRVNVVFYAAIADATLAVIITGLVLFFVSYFKSLGSFEKFLLLVIWLLAGYGFAISIPTVIDRSLSFYILEKLQQRGGGIKQASFADVFTKEYVKEYRLVDVRLTEQLESGTIVIKDGCVILTEKGNVIADVGKFYRQHLLPKHRLLMGEYTDALTDPFRHSDETPNYTCQGVSNE